MTGASHDMEKYQALTEQQKNTIKQTEDVYFASDPEDICGWTKQLEQFWSDSLRNSAEKMRSSQRGRGLYPTWKWSQSKGPPSMADQVISQTLHMGPPCYLSKSYGKSEDSPVFVIDQERIQSRKSSICQWMVACCKAKGFPPNFETWCSIKH